MVMSPFIFCFGFSFLLSNIPNVYSEESRVPDIPSFLRVQPLTDSIEVTWNSPRDQFVIRGYVIGWGIGIPDIEQIYLDNKQRYSIIKGLQPSTEYVISLRAFNSKGESSPVYETVKTSIETTREPAIPMLPPLGLKATVLSSTSVFLTWTDTTLPKNQRVCDNRYYTIRYTSHFLDNSGFKFINATNQNTLVSDLKPNTHYEFAVKVIKDLRESTWSFGVHNTTYEANLQCEDGWVIFKNHCYLFRQSKKSWIAAKVLCEIEGSHVVNILNKEENDFITANMYDSIWTSGNDIEKEDKWQWNKETIMTYTNWLPKAPDHYYYSQSYLNKETDCAMIRKQDGYWVANRCSDIYQYVCKYKLGKKKKGVFQEDKRCKKGWKFYDNSCYFMHQERKNWKDAKIECRNNGSDLVSIFSEEENLYLYAQMNNYFWTSGNDILKEGDWKWANGKPIAYKNWNKQEPDNLYNTDCMSVNNVYGMWDDKHCKLLQNFICKHSTDEETEVSQVDEYQDTVLDKNCKDGWKFYDGSCYWFSSESKSWIDAQYTCRNNDSQLVYIMSMDENNYIHDHIGDSDVWTGGNEIEKEDFWVWGQNFKMSFTNWIKQADSYSDYIYTSPYSFSKPRNQGINCLIFSTRYGLWQAYTCNSLRQFVCKYNKDDQFIIDNKGCYEKWQPYQDSCYITNTFSTTWENAEKKCAIYGSHLVNVANKDEANFIKALLYISQANEAWIGNKNPEVSYESQANETWIGNKNQEDGSNNNTDICYYMQLSESILLASEWGKSSCDAEKSYICKYSKST